MPVTTVASTTFSLNQRTLGRCELPRLLDLLGHRGIGWVGLWLEPVWELGVARTRRLLDESGVRVSSVCRAAGLTQGGDAAARSRNLRAVEATAELGADCLAVVAGGLPAGSRDLDRARGVAREELAVLAAAAQDAGVRLALEPMHPVFGADRGVVSSLRQAAEWVGDLPVETVGLAMDSFHLWWEPDLEQTWTSVADRVLGVQVGDWVTPLEVGRADGIVQRGVPGDGHLDLAGFVALARRLGWDGPVEVELFNDRLDERDPGESLDLLVERCAGII